MPHEGVGKEHPKTHHILIGSIITFLIVWIFDSFFLNISTILANFVPLIIRIILCAVFIILGYYLADASSKMVLSEDKPNDLKKTGIYSHVRNPMYLMQPVIYMGLTLLTLSLISIIPIIASFYAFNIFVKFEESDLEQIFGEEYIKYKSRVRRWLPSITSVKL